MTQASSGVGSRSYADAVAALNTLQSNFVIVDAIRKSGKGMNRQAIPEMIEWCRKAGYKPSDFDRLSPIHIAGTKGKGSTSAFIASILSQYRLESFLPKGASSAPLHQVGLYTSPHLRFVRERIQINGEPLSEEIFAKYFFEIWDRLEASARAAGMPTDTTSKPVYFRYLTLMAFHTYLSAEVDTAVIECGIGGEYDSTNVIVNPAVTAVTSLGIDHTAMLGSTIEEIAWHKSGIFKPGVKAFTVRQPGPAAEVLASRAIERGVILDTVDIHPDLENITLGLAADFQKINASLAIAVAAAYLRTHGHDDIPLDITTSSAPLPPRFRQGLEQVKWPGRCEIRHDPRCRGLRWCIDSGHTLESIKVAGTWFADQIISSGSSALKSLKGQKRILIFNQQTRDANALARALYKTLTQAIGGGHPFTHVIFCTNVTFAKGGYKPDLVSVNTNDQEIDELIVQNALAKTWRAIEATTVGQTTDIAVLKTIEEAVERVRTITSEASGEVTVLVTGSVHLVGGVLDVLETN